MKYKRPGFFNSLHFFDLMHEWFRKTVLENYNLGVEQKVIEVLARYPGISFEELVQKTGVDEYEVKKCLINYTRVILPNR